LVTENTGIAGRRGCYASAEPAERNLQDHHGLIALR